MQILLISDSRLVADRLVGRISALERATVISFDGRLGSALEFIRKKSPDVVIIDTHLEDGRGMDLLREIKQLGTSPVIIAVSTSNVQQYVRQSLKEGADCFFILPDEINELVEFLEG